MCEVKRQRFFKIKLSNSAISTTFIKTMFLSDFTKYIYPQPWAPADVFQGEVKRLLHFFQGGAKKHIPRLRGGYAPRRTPMSTTNFRK